jgi:signal transduction histidine kinase
MWATQLAQLSAHNEMLELAARQWRTTADAIDDALIMIGATGTILRMNSAAAAPLGRAFSWVGQPSACLAGCAPWNTALDLAREALARHVVVTGRAHDPVLSRTWDLWARPIPDSVHSGVLLIARDITELLELQNSVRRAETMAELGTLTAGFAHEVRNPLFAISSLVEAWALQPRHDPAPFSDALRREVTRLQTLMVDLLEFGKPSREVFEPRWLSATVHGAMRACQPEAKAAKVRLILSILADGEISMSPSRLERVFVNLLQNAIQHSPAGADVAIEIDTAPDSANPGLKIVVRDHGPGIPPGDVLNVFNPFFSRRVGGFGLGLAITQRIVQEHRGCVTASNDPTGGAVMTVTVPLSQSPDRVRTATETGPQC